MAYTPKTWECGETITADALNHIEQGIEDCCGSGSEPLILHTWNTVGTQTYLDKTWEEVYQADLNNTPVILEIIQPDPEDETEIYTTRARMVGFNLYETSEFWSVQVAFVTSSGVARAMASSDSIAGQYTGYLYINSGGN